MPAPDTPDPMTKTLVETYAKNKNKGKEPEQNLLTKFFRQLGYMKALDPTEKALQDAKKKAK